MIGGIYAVQQKYSLFHRTKLDGFLPGLGNQKTQESDTKSFSGFTQFYYDVSEKLRIQAGLRYSYEKATAAPTTANTFSTDGGFNQFDSPLIPGSFIRATGSETWSEFGYKFGVDYNFHEDLMVYGYYARGFKSGGFTQRIERAEDIGPYDPEYLDTYEIGIKGEFLDGRLRSNFSLFYYQYDDMQVTQNVTYPDGGNTATVLNAAEAEIKGFELELTALAVDSLTLSVSIANLDSEFKEFSTPAGQALKGNKLQDAPRWHTVESVNYRMAALRGHLDFFLQHTYTSSKYSYFTNNPLEEVDSLNLFNANITWTAPDESWSLGLYGRNLADKEYFTQKIDFGVLAIAGVGAPREFGLDLRLNW